MHVDDQMDHDVSETDARQKKETANKKAGRVFYNIGVFILSVVLFGGTLFGTLAASEASKAEQEKVISVIEKNYDVNDVSAAGAGDSLPWTGVDVAISTADQVHVCRGVKIEEVEAKEPLHCEGFSVVESNQ